MQAQKIVSKTEAREILRQYGREWNKPELINLANALITRKPIYPRAKAQRGSLTPELAVKISAYKAEHPRMSNYDIGVVFGVNGARVSEAVHGVNTGE